MCHNKWQYCTSLNINNTKVEIVTLLLFFLTEPEVVNGPYDPIKISAKYHEKITVNRSYDGKF